MRLSPIQSQMICQQIHHHFGDSAAIWLFGSRLDDQKRGGDVDLYVEAAHHTLLDEIRRKIHANEDMSEIIKIDTSEVLRLCAMVS